MHIWLRQHFSDYRDRLQIIDFSVYRIASLHNARIVIAAINFSSENNTKKYYIYTSEMISIRFRNCDNIY